MEVVRLENRPEGAKFEDVRELVSGARGKTVYETGDIDAGIWSAGITIGLIHDIVSLPSLPWLAREILDILRVRDADVYFSSGCSLRARSCVPTLSAMPKSTSTV